MNFKGKDFRWAQHYQSIIDGVNDIAINAEYTGCLLCIYYLGTQCSYG